MKKLFITLTTVLALSMVFSACKKDENTDPKEPQKETPTPQKANKSVKVTGIYLTQNGQQYNNINNIQIQRLTQSQKAQIGVAANFVNDGPEGVTEDDVIVVRAYVNDKLVGNNEIELTAVTIGEGKLIPIPSLFPMELTGALCEGVNEIPICVEVVRVNKTMLNKKFTAALKIVDK